MQNLNSVSFQSFIQGDGVLVDFWATWCGPCMRQGQALEQIVKDHPELSDRIGKVNVDEAQDLAIQFGIDAIPALLFFKKGELVQTLVGLQPTENIVSLLQK